MEKTGSKLILKNVMVRFADYDRDYYAEITSDFAIGVPTMSFARTAAMPDLFDYVLVANEAMEVTGGSFAEIRRRTYGGNEGVTVGDWTNGASLDIQSPLFVTKGPILVQGASPSSVFSSSPETSVYAHDLVVEQGDMKLLGKTYVANDLTFNGKGKVTVSGDYYGYGNSLTDANESSAILVNARNTDSVLDISGVNNILLSGHAFIGTSGATGYGETENGKPSISMNKQDVVMDQTIAVKGDQIAYLIPGDCIGVWQFKDGTTETLVGMNPLPEAAYKQNDKGELELDLDSYITDACYEENEDGSRGAPNGEMKVVDMNRPVVALGGRSLSEFSTTYRLIYRRQNGKPMAYFYAVMQDETKAREYMAAYMGAKEGNLKNLYNYYLGDYGNVISDPDENGYEIITPGEYMVNYGEGGWKLAGGNTTAADQSSTFYALDETYKALCAKLIERRAELSVTELSRTVYENIVDDEKLSDMAEATRIYENEGGGLFGIVSKSDVVLSAVSGVDPAQVRLILSQGDITIDRNFSGLALAKGKIIIDSVAAGATKDSPLLIDTSRVDMPSVLKSTTYPEPPIDFFYGSSQYVLEGTSVSTNGTSAEDQKLDITRLVEYENWTKR